MVKVTPVCWILPKAIVCYYFYFTTGFQNDAFELPLAIWYGIRKHFGRFLELMVLTLVHIFIHYKFARLPFDTEHPLVYLIVITYQYIVLVYGFLLLTCCLSMGIGGFLFLRSATTDIKRNLRQFNKCVRIKRHQLRKPCNQRNNKRTHKQTNEQTFKQLVDIIELHSDSKKFVSVFRLIR